MIAAGKLLLNMAGSVVLMATTTLARAEPRPCSKGAEFSFERDILPIFREQCVSCHFSREGATGLDLRPQFAYTSLVGRKSLMANELLVKPGEPEHSFLIEKISDTPRVGQKMPSYGSILTPRQSQSIVEWVRQGAKDN